MSWRRFSSPSWHDNRTPKLLPQSVLQGKVLNEVVSERWGSLAELSSGLTERRAAPGAPGALLRCAALLYNGVC